MKVLSFFLLSSSLIFSSFLSHASVGAAVPVYSQNNENIDVTSSSGDKYITVDISRTMEELLIFFEEEDLVITATKQPQTVADAPAIATVISGEEIRNMGARDIVDILNRIAGIHVTKGFYGKEEIEARGIKNINSDKIKLLIDGHSVNDNMTGGFVWAFDSLTVDNVKRIEVIRGPGSALYGSNAVSAVINIITKDGKDIDGIQLSAAGGNFNTSKANLQAGKKFNDLEIAFSLDYFSTDGDRLTVKKDKGNYDFPNRVPGKTKDYEDKFDAGLKVAYKDFTFNSKYLSRERSGYFGNIYWLTDETEVNVTRYFGELAYEHGFSNSGKIRIKTYVDHLDWDVFWEIIPEGYYGLSNEGMLANPSLRERTYGGEAQLDYKLFDKNLITFGALKEERKQSGVKGMANFNANDFTPQTYQPMPLWNKNKIRHVWAVYLQDVWDVNDKINLTLGARHDDYSDFGGSTNPRAGMVWKFIESWDLKLLYGTAFRAPSFEELYNDNNPVADGNPDLNPEEMTTYEVSIGHSYGEKSNARITYFNNYFKDKIDLISARFQNTGGAKIWGIETEWKGSFSSTFSAYLNYTYQNTEDKDTGKRIADVTPHKGNIGANIKLTNYLNVNTNIFLSGERPRSTLDPRSSASAYELVDLTVIAKNFFNSLEFRCSVHNLLDREYEDPSPMFYDVPASEWRVTVENDFPREGRSYMLEAMYKF